jgi:hypothetical protein
MTTALLARPAPAPRHATAPPLAWELDRTRCAVGVDLDLPGATIWRARLRPLAARLTATTLTANLSVRPALASLPLTRGLFLRGVARTARIWLEADGDLRGPGPVRLAGELSAGSRSWPAQLWVRRTELPDDRVLLTVAGSVRTPERTFPGTRVRFDAVGEFEPCG